MTREELKAHCEKQIRACEMWAHSQGERPCGKVYEEHKLILELLEQKNVVIDKIRAEIIERDRNVKAVRSDCCCIFTAEQVLDIIDIYEAESEE